MRQHQLAALFRERGWTYRLMGGFDSANTPTKQLTDYGLVVELDVHVPEDAQTSDAGIYLQVTTGGVRFLRGQAAVALADVPGRCFSEVMRDIDLFVSAAPIA